MRVEAFWRNLHPTVDGEGKKIVFSFTIMHYLSFGQSLNLQYFNEFKINIIIINNKIFCIIFSLYILTQEVKLTLLKSHHFTDISCNEFMFRKIFDIF